MAERYVVVRRYLEQIKMFQIKMDQVNDQYRTLTQNAIRMGGAPEGERVQTSVSGDRLAEDVAKIVDSEDELLRLWNYYASERVKRITQIQMVDDQRYEQILYKRYVEDKDFFVIADELSYSDGHVKRLHAEAIKEFRKHVI